MKLNLPSHCTGEKLDTNMLSKHACRFLQCGQGNGIIIGIQEPVNHRTACFHPSRHFRFSQVMFLHPLFQLNGDDALFSRGTDFLEYSLNRVRISHNPCPKLSTTSQLHQKRYIHQIHFVYLQYWV